MAPLELEESQEKQAKESLKALANRIDLPEGVIYLDGNSLGPLPHAAKTRIEWTVRDEWGGMSEVAEKTVDMVSIEVDGIPLAVPKNSMIIEATDTRCLSH